MLDDARERRLVNRNFEEAGDAADAACEIGLQLVEMEQHDIGQMPHVHQLRTFSQNGQKGWPSSSSQSRKYCRTSSGGFATSGPTRPGVSLTAWYRELVGIGVMIVHAPHHVPAVSGDVEVFAFGEKTSASTGRCVLTKRR